MSFSPALRLAVAVVLGLAAVLVGRAWLVGQANSTPAQSAATQTAPIEAVEAEPEMATVLAASRDIEAGELVDSVVVDEIDWPAGVLPAGALTDASDLIRLFNGDAYARGFIAAGEPIVDAKLSGEPLRVVLTAEITPGYRAIAISVSDTTGVAGFVLPEDRVDIYAISRSYDRGDQKRSIVADLGNPGQAGVVLNNVRVLAVDQSFDKTLEGARPSRTVTVEVLPKDVARLSAAAQVAELSLALIGDEELEEGAPEPVVAEVEPPKQPVRRYVRRAPAKPKTADIRIIHGTREKEIEAPVAPNRPSEKETQS